MNKLRITLFAGLIIFIISAGIFTFFLLVERSHFATTRQQDSFNRILREFDNDFNDLYLTEREFERLNGELDKLEKRAIGVESWLSILKRRRAIAAIHPPSNDYYRESINNALKAYPSSQPIMVIAAANLVKNAAVNRESEEQLRVWLPNINDYSFNTLRLALHIIIGDLNNPVKAMEIPYNLYTNGIENITVNLAILKTLNRNYRDASSDVQILLASPSISKDALTFAAEYHYDFGDLVRSAEIFSVLGSDYSMSRQADALYLAGYIEIATSIWNVLAERSHETSLYNLAITTNDSRRSRDFLEKLVGIETISNKESRQFGLIRYSRMLDYNSATSLLRSTVNFSPLNFPYIDLEICKRHTQSQNLGRQIAETWLLLDRHEKNEELYKWAFWHFFFQRSYDEIDILLDRMDLIQLEGDWINLYRAIYFMRDGNLEIAERILREIHPDEANWTVNANLGRILENYRSPARAIEQYDLASSKVPNLKSASRIQLRIARCFMALNRPGEARRALFFALDLDPDNHTARLELDKLM